MLSLCQCVLFTFVDFFVCWCVYGMWGLHLDLVVSLVYCHGGCWGLYLC